MPTAIRSLICRCSRLVGHPVAVNPDGELEDVAHDRGWPVVVFARKTKQAIALGASSTAAVSVAVGSLPARHAGTAGSSSAPRRR